MALTSMSVIMTVFVLNLHHRGPNKHTVPNWLKIVLLQKLSPYLCLQEGKNDISRFINTEEKFIKNMSLKITLENIQQALQNDINLDNAEQSHNSIYGQLCNLPVQPEVSIQSHNSPIIEHQTFSTANYVLNHAKTTSGELSQRKSCTYNYETLNHENIAQTNVRSVTQTTEAMTSCDQSRQQTTSQNRNENNRRNKRRSNTNLSKTNDEILHSLKRILEKHEKEDRDYEVIQEWRRVAQCVDRILFFIFLVATVSSTLAILVIAPATQ